MAKSGKLRKGDIKIVSEGIQLRKWLKENGYGTLEQFAKTIDYSYNSVKSKGYVGKRIKCPKFKAKFNNYTGTKIGDFIIPLEEQVINLIIKTLGSIQLYCVSTIAILEALIKLASPYGLYYELLSKMLLVYYNTSNNDVKESLHMLKEIKELAIENGFNDILVYIMTEYAFVYLMKGENTKALETYKSFMETETFKQVVNATKSNINRKILYTYYYRYGLSLTRNKRHEEGRRQLNEAIKYTENVTRIYMNIGLSYKLQGYYKIAIEYYYKALKFCNNPIDEATIYNNLANAYYAADEIEKAKHCTKKSIDMVDNTFHICETYNFVDTFFMVFQYSKRCMKFNKILKWTKKINKCTNYGYSYKFLCSSITYCVRNNYMVQLERMFGLLDEIIKQEKNEDVEKEIIVLYYRGRILKKELMEES